MSVPSINHKSGVKSWAVKTPSPHAPKTWNNDSDFYNGQAWRRCRKSCADANPLCEVSHYENRYHAAKDFDHIIPVRMGGAKYDPANIMGLTTYYHRVKTRMERDKDTPLVAWKDTENGKVPIDRTEICRLILKGVGRL